jgi:hypothetical protein
MEIQIARLENLLPANHSHPDNNMEFIMNTDALDDDASEPSWRA